MKQDEFDRAVARAERAYAKLVRIRDGIEEVEHDDALGIRRWRPGREVGTRRQHARSSERRVLFNRPLTRSIRLANAAGATSFHIQHHAIGKVTHEMNEDGLRNRPGAARAHSRYVEREVAVAAIDPELAAQEATLGHGSGAGAADLDIPFESTPQSFIIDPENDHEHDWQQYLGFDPVVTGTLVAELAGPESRPIGTWANGAGKDAGSYAGMRLLSRRDVVRHGRRADGHLPGAQDVSLEAGAEDDGLRQPASHLRGAGNPVAGLATLASVGEAPDHDRYIGRMEAVAIQPDGTRALITNIDADDEERARFWSLVEKHEAVASTDQMSFRMSDRPAFWKAAASRPDCPAELNLALTTNRPSEMISFDIASGKAMRAFLKKQPGWVEPSRASKAAGMKPFAAFHDRRKGRIQYRVVGELPDELVVADRFAIVRDFAAIFEQRKMPFVAVVHAPDHHNNEKNWHFHLIYYDRPCRRVSAVDIAALADRGFTTDGLEPGMWDFAVVTPKRGRANGKATSLKQNKVAEVTGDNWIKNLRHELAALTNRHLARAGEERRLDPRRYTEMGIVADPQEHLGTRQAAAETRGETTKTGSENELRQWRAWRRAMPITVRQSPTPTSVSSATGACAVKRRRPKSLMIRSSRCVTGFIRQPSSTTSPSACTTGSNGRGRGHRMSVRPTGNSPRQSTPIRPLAASPSVTSPSDWSPHRRTISICSTNDWRRNAPCWRIAATVLWQCGATRWRSNSNRIRRSLRRP